MPSILSSGISVSWLMAWNISIVKELFTKILSQETFYLRLMVH